METNNKKIVELQNLVKQLKGIASTTQNPERKSWAAREIKKTYNELKELGSTDVDTSTTNDTTKLETIKDSDSQKNSGKSFFEEISQTELSNDSTQLLKNFPTKVFEPWPKNYELNLINTFLHIWSNYFLVYLQSRDMFSINIFSKERNNSYLVIEQLNRKLILLGRNLDIYKNKGKLEVMYRDMKKNSIELSRRTLITDTSKFVNKLYNYWVKIYKELKNKDSIQNENNSFTPNHKFRMASFEDEIKDIHQYSQKIITPNDNEKLDPLLITNKEKTLEDLLFELVDFLKEVQKKLLTKSQKENSGSGQLSNIDKIIFENKE